MSNNTNIHIGIINPKCHLDDQFKQAAKQFNARVEKHFFSNVADCRYTLDHINTNYALCIVCVDDDEKETIDVVRELYMRYRAHILVIDCKATKYKRVSWIDYTKAGASACITDQTADKLVDVIQAIKTDHNVFETKNNQLEYYKKHKNLSHLELKVAELLLERQQVSELIDSDLSSFIDDDMFDNVQDALLDQLQLTNLSDVLPYVLAATCQNKCA